jgi:hypothetical protein
MVATRTATKGKSGFDEVGSKFVAWIWNLLSHTTHRYHFVAVLELAPPTQLPTSVLDSTCSGCHGNLEVGELQEGFESRKTDAYLQFGAPPQSSVAIRVLKSGGFNKLGRKLMIGFHWGFSNYAGGFVDRKMSFSPLRDKRVGFGGKDKHLLEKEK